MDRRQKKLSTSGTQSGIGSMAGKKQPGSKKGSSGSKPPLKPKLNAAAPKAKSTKMSLREVEKKIRASHREIDWNTKEGHHRTKVQFLSALHGEQYEDALELINLLVEYDPVNEMFQQYQTHLEGIVKQQAEESDGDDDGDEGVESDDDDDTDDDESSSSDTYSDVPLQHQNPQEIEDEAEKKDDDGDSLARRYGVDVDDAKYVPEDTLDLTDERAGMSPAQNAKLDELKAQFSSLRASVQDKEENEARLWNELQPAMSSQSGPPPSKEEFKL